MINSLTVVLMINGKNNTRTPKVIILYNSMHIKLLQDGTFTSCFAYDFFEFLITQAFLSKSSSLITPMKSAVTLCCVITCLDPN
jgi:hypothetical protein